MATKKPTKSKTRTTTKKQGFQFKWWMATGLVAVVALVGVLVLRYSKAYGPNDCYWGVCTSGVVRGNNGYGLITIEEFSAGRSTGLHNYQLTGISDSGFNDAHTVGLNDCVGIQPTGNKGNPRLTLNSTVNVVKGCG